MSKPDFVYVTYIASTPEKVWQAFVDTDMMARYWVGPTSEGARVNVSDWKVGSTWEHRRVYGSNEVDICGKVLEFDPPRRMAYTWSRPADAGDERKHSRVAIDIELRIEGLVKLTVAHHDLRDDAKMLEGISGGWPAVLCNLKTLLETGRPLPHQAPAANPAAVGV